MTYSLTFSPVFKITLQRLCRFLERKFSPELSESTRKSIKKALTKKLPDNPFCGPVSNRLLDLGVGGYRQLNVDEHNIVIYRVDEEAKVISILLVFDARQSLQKLLLDVNLLL